MADNGDNPYDVTFGRIMFLDKILSGHDNVYSINRHHDIVFDVVRIEPHDALQIVCVDEYTLSEAKAREIIEDFPKVRLMFVGGKWNGWSPDARDYCRAKKIGICNAGGINAALRKTQYWR